VMPGPRQLQVVVLRRARSFGAKFLEPSLPLNEVAPSVPLTHGRVPGPMAKAYQVLPFWSEVSFMQLKGQPILYVRPKGWVS